MLHMRPVASIIALVLANLLPLAGIFLFGWDVGIIVFLYWTENVVVGTLAILKIALVRVDAPVKHVGKPFVIAFFCLHYGVFCAGHGLFVRSFFDFPSSIEQLLPRFVGVESVFLPVLAGRLLSSLASGVSGIIGWSMIALLVSHSVSFLLNFVWHGEAQVLTIKQVMLAPYLRMAALHVALIAGGIAISRAGSPAPLLVVLVLAKIGLDIVLHVREHRKS